MSDDAKLPALYKRSALGHVPTPINEQSLLERVVSGYVSKFNTRIIAHSTEELRARTEYAEEYARLVHSSLSKDRAIAQYLDRDNILREDQERREEERAQSQHERWLKRSQRLHEEAVLSLKQERELMQARRAAAYAEWGLEAFELSLPHRKKRLRHLFRSGALDAALGEELYSQELHASKSETSPLSNGSALEAVLTTLEADIKTARANHMSEEFIAGLEASRAHVSVLIEAEKNRPQS